MIRYSTIASIIDNVNKYGSKNNSSELLPMIIEVWKKAGLDTSERYPQTTNMLYFDTWPNLNWQDIAVLPEHVPQILQAVYDLGYEKKFKVSKVRHGKNLLEDFNPMKDTFTKDEIIKAVMEYNGGCDEGKKAFLKESLGIEPPTPRRIITIEVDAHFYNDKNHISGIRQGIRKAQQFGYENTFANAEVISVEDKT